MRTVEWSQTGTVVNLKVRIRPMDDPLEYSMWLGDTPIYFYPGQLKTLGLAIMAQVETDEIARQSAEDWDAERADAEAL